MFFSGRLVVLGAHVRPVRGGVVKVIYRAGQGAGSHKHVEGDFYGGGSVVSHSR